MNTYTTPSSSEALASRARPSWLKVASNLVYLPDKKGAPHLVSRPWDDC